MSRHRPKSCPPVPPPFPPGDTLKFSALVDIATGDVPLVAFLADRGNALLADPKPLRYPVPRSSYSHLRVTILTNLGTNDELTVAVCKNGTPVPGASIDILGGATAPVTLPQTFPAITYDETLGDTLDVKVTSSSLGQPVELSATVSA